MILGFLNRISTLISDCVSKKSQHMLSECDVQTSPHYQTISNIIQYKVISSYSATYKFVCGVTVSHAAYLFHLLHSYWSLIYAPKIFKGVCLTRLYLLFAGVLSELCSNRDIFQPLASLSEFPPVTIFNTDPGNGNHQKTYKLIIRQLHLQFTLSENSKGENSLHSLINFSETLSNLLHQSVVSLHAAYLPVTVTDSIYSSSETKSIYEFVMKKYWFRYLVNKSHFIPYVPCIIHPEYSSNVNSCTPCIHTNKATHVSFSITENNTQNMTAHQHKSERSFYTPNSNQELSKHRSYALVSANSSIHPPLLNDNLSIPPRRQNSTSSETDEISSQQVGHLFSDSPRVAYGSHNVPRIHFKRHIQNLKYGTNATAFSPYMFPEILDSDDLCRNHQCQQSCCCCCCCSSISFKTPFRQHTCTTPQHEVWDPHINCYESTFPYCYHMAPFYCRGIIPSRMRCSGFCRLLHHAGVDRFPQPTYDTDSSFGVFVDMTNQNVSIFVERLPPIDNDNTDNIGSKLSGSLPCSNCYESSGFTKCIKTCKRNTKIWIHFYAA
uniref:Uncharacterized protein n=1 Tax=Trichobilharzia regenti TaxID=157069 RepID=A0AA85JUH4_TRIRE|nr:unnamed protein product [Trichobilharzia regenti]